MKKIILQVLCCLFAIAAISTTAQAQDSAEMVKEIAKPIMTFDKSMIDLGEVKRGEKRSFSYSFTNTGNADLDIDLITACDCTTTNQDDLRRRTFKPGESGILEVTFDSTEKEESETIDIDIILKQFDEEANMPFIEMLQYKFELIK